MTDDCVGDSVTHVSLTKDSQCVLINTLNNKIRLLDRKSGQLLNTFEGHENTKYKLASMLTKDEARVVSGSEDGSVAEWDVVEAKVSLWSAHSAAVSAVAAHPQGHLLTAGFDGKVIQWQNKLQ